MLLQSKDSKPNNMQYNKEFENECNLFKTINISTHYICEDCQAFTEYELPGKVCTPCILKYLKELRYSELFDELPFSDL